MLRIFLGLLILGQPFLFRWKPEVINVSYWFLIYLVVVMLINWIVGKVVFAGDLKNLKRAKAKLSFNNFYTQMAVKHSKAKLILGLLGSLIFFIGGILMIVSDQNMAGGIVCVMFFGLATASWGFALRFKAKLVMADKQTKSKT